MKEAAEAPFNAVPPKDFFRGFKIESNAADKNNSGDEEADEDSMNVE